MLDRLGVFAAALAACLWGVVFVVPIWFGALSTTALLAGRFGVFGLISVLIVVVFYKNQLKLLDLRLVQQGLLNAFLSGIGMYLAIVLSVRWAGGVTASVITGLVPPAVAFVSAKSEGEPFPPRLVVPSVIVLLGVVLTGWEGSDAPRDGEMVPAGIVMGIVAVSMFAWFSVANARLLRATPGLASVFWSSFLGICNLPWVIGIVIWAYVTRAGIEGIALFDVAAASVILGIICSAGGLALWSIGSRRVPQRVIGYFIVLEPITGVALSLLAIRQMPDALIVDGVVLSIAGLVLSVRINQKAPTSPRSLPAT